MMMGHRPRVANGTGVPILIKQTCTKLMGASVNILLEIVAQR